MKNSTAIIVGAIASTILVGGIYKIVSKPSPSTLALQEMTRRSEQRASDLEDATAQASYEANIARLNRLVTVTNSPLCEEYQGKTVEGASKIITQKILATSSREEELKVYELSEFCVPPSEML
jgi:hypothetical protein